MSQKFIKKSKRLHIKQLQIARRKNIFEASSKTTKDGDYMHHDICKEVARHGKEERKHTTHL
jgi:hypothetical protein